MLPTFAHRRLSFSLFAALVFAHLAPTVPAGEIGFLEEFALAEDRGKVIERLIPGTTEYYFYSCLHAQQQGELDRVDDLLAQWIKRHGRSARTREMENRQALLRYSKNPQEALKFLRERLDLRFDHQRTAVDEKPQFPTRLDVNLVSRDAFARRAISRHRSSTKGFEDRALAWASTLDLNADQRRDLVARLRRPDVSALVQLVIEDLNHRNSRGFGSRKVHGLLLLSQMNELTRLRPSLLNESRFVNAYMTKLWPGADDNWRHDAEIRERFLARLWTFVSRLNATHNSLKVHVLYHRLVHDRALGVFDKNRFMTYLRLPRNVPYLKKEHVNRPEHRRYRADLNADYRSATQLPRVGSDEELVRSYLQHFLVAEATPAAYAPYVDDRYLKRVFAETKILAGIGDMEKWYSMLSPNEYRALHDRVDLDFVPTNRRLFAPEDPVALDVDVKNVKSLLVKVFEINTLNYFLANARPVNTAIDLDGLVPNEEKVYKYSEPPLRRVRRHFEFPTLRRRGTYVIDFIGNGKSSRALISKGQLRYIQRVTSAGQLFTILDESNRKLKDATLWLSGHHYMPDDNGEILVPFTNNAGKQAILLEHNGFASAETFLHKAESYQLTAGFYVDREALIRRRKAAIILRPTLRLNHVPVSLEVLKNPTLSIKSVDRDGVATTREIKNLRLSAEQEAVVEILVPERLARLELQLRADVRNLSQAKTHKLRSAQAFDVNGVDATVHLETLHLRRDGADYVLDFLGRTGETKADRAVKLTLKHQDFRDTFDVTLKTDPVGEIQLGSLSGIDWIRGSGPEGARHQWTLRSDAHSPSYNIHGRSGETLRVAYMGRALEPTRADFSLLERRGRTYVTDRFDALSVADGFVELKGLPAGDYELFLHEEGRRVQVRLTAGEYLADHVLSRHRHLGVNNPAPLQITNVNLEDKELKVQLENSSEDARVHVIATYFVPEYSIYDHLLSANPEPGWSTLGHADAQYVIGRDIGDEYRYIIDRKYAKKYPGNMLSRPAVLLNPWAIRATETRTYRAGEGTEFAAREPVATSAEATAAAPAARTGGISAGGGFPNLNFLARSSTVLVNLRPDEQGVVTIPRKDLGAHHHLHVLAVDPENTVYRQLSLPSDEVDFLDLRLAGGLNPDKHYSEQKQVSIIKKDEQFKIDDITTSKLEYYDTLEKVFALFSTLSGNGTLVEFGFIRNWPKLKLEEKKEKYSQYACHELNFFLYNKDPKFFADVIAPYIANKKDKTFLDRWLLNENLSSFLEPWAFAQLNIVERILLARRVPVEAARSKRHVQDLLDLLTVNRDHLDRLFETAIKGRALDTEAPAALKGARKRVPGEFKRGATLALKPKADRLSSRALALGVDEEDAAEVEEESLELAREEQALMDHLKKAPAAKAKSRAGAPERAKSRRQRMRRLAELRNEVRQLYRRLEQTQEWVENNYYKLPIESQNANLITVNAFWNDFAAHDGEGGFFSPHLALAARNFPEMMFALAVLDLPFTAEEPEIALADDGVLKLRAAGPLVIYHKQIRATEASDEKTPILVSQNFYRMGDRYRHVNNERVDNYIDDEFLIHTVYGCHVVITNPTSSRQKLDILLQIPVGAIPVQKGKYTNGVHIDLEPYRTWTTDFLFYFPAAGDFRQFPVHVAAREKLVASSAPATFHVVERPTKVDQQSWEYVSQHASEAQVLEFLNAHNLGRLDLDRMAWRLRKGDFHKKVLALLDQRHVYHHTTWSYGLLHNDAAAIREYLKHSTRFLNQCGYAIDCELIKIDPVERKTYQHMEYKPLVNARAHSVGKTRRILNDRFFQQYMRLLSFLSYRDQLDDNDRLSVTYYLGLQDRVDDALAQFQQVRPRRIASRLQYDYLKSYFGFYTDDLRQARTIATQYANYPVDRWRKVFNNVAGQLDEIEGKELDVVDKDDRTQVQTKLAATEPSFELEPAANGVTLAYKNLKGCRVNYYLMDIELLFSRNPFVQQFTGHFSYIRPNHTETVKLDTTQSTQNVVLPPKFQNQNVMIEVVAAGARKAKPFFSNMLRLQLTENYGQARVTDKKTGRALAKVYLKVYALLQDGTTRFYKDGYTDLRGRFDYSSLSTNELGRVRKFSVLALSEDHGAVVREAQPPKT